VLREIRSRKKRFFIRRHDDGQGPAAAAREHLADSHINVVDVRSFFPIHLDADKGIVHQAGHFGIFKALMLHDMAPVTG